AALGVSLRGQYGERGPVHCHGRGYRLIGERLVGMSGPRNFAECDDFIAGAVRLAREIQLLVELWRPGFVDQKLAVLRWEAMMGIGHGESEFAAGPVGRDFPFAGADAADRLIIGPQNILAVFANEASALLAVRLLSERVRDRISQLKILSRRLEVE